MLEHYDTIFSEIEQKRMASQQVVVKTREDRLKSDAKTKRRASIRMSGEGAGASKKEGNLQVLEKKKWVQRWCCVRDKALYVYKAPKDKKAKLKLPLAESQVASAVAAGKPFAFCITFPKKNQTNITLAADDATAQDDWMAALKIIL